ncbi:MAG: hypothetical protein D6690_13325 [Nitrospirae bacterium]|nr:MAG: hypothetical protein D6690_13325 [Nitrospirota bacterium]
MNDLRPSEWIALIHQHYLQHFIRNGGSAVKIVVGNTPHTCSTVREKLGRLAEQEGFIAVHVDARDTKLHMMDRLFHQISRSIDWDELAHEFVVRLLIEHGYQLPTDRAQFQLSHIAAMNGRAEPLLRRDLNTWLERAIYWDPSMSQEFRFAMIRLCLAQLDPGAVSPFMTDAVKAWLQGELRHLSALKEALIFQKVARHNARHLLASLVHWLRLLGKSGLVLTLDLSQYLVVKRSTSAQGFLYSAAAAMDAYELLRQFIDGTDEIEGLMLVGLVPPEFLSDPRRGIGRYEALKLRVWDDVRDRTRQNPLGALVKLTADDEAEALPLPSRADASLAEHKNVFHEQVIEALRAGVPNAQVVQALESHQPEIEGRFRRMLQDVEASITTDTMATGLLVEGGFGTGKSHLLEMLQHIALEQHFVCSHVVISKETPLHNLATMFRAAIESAKVPQKCGDALTEIAGELNFQSPQFSEFYEWVHRGPCELDSRFAATLHLYEHLLNDPELSHRMIRFWAGDPLSNGELKKYLQGASALETYTFNKISLQDLMFHRFKFVARLIRAAGYRGWILLIDEAEIIARYSFKQRAKSYREVARWMGVLPDAGIPGLGAVIALTDDFVSVMFEEKGDRNRVADLEGQEESVGLQILAREATEGIRHIDTSRVPLARPYDKLIEETYDKVRVMHGSAYHWEAPPLDRGEQLTSTRMREYVRGWITEWDLRRLYPGEAVEIEFTKMQQNYSEDAEFEVSDEGEPSHDEAFSNQDAAFAMLTPHHEP